MPFKAIAILDTLNNGTRQSVQEATDKIENPALALAFSCAARRRFLGLRTKNERDVLWRAAQCPTAVVYVFGEIAPLDGQLPSAALNESFVTLLLGE